MANLILIAGVWGVSVLPAPTLALVNGLPLSTGESIFCVLWFLIWAVLGVGAIARIQDERKLLERRIQQLEDDRDNLLKYPGLSS